MSGKQKQNRKKQHSLRQREGENSIHRGAVGVHLISEKSIKDAVRKLISAESRTHGDHSSLHQPEINS